MNTKLSGFRIRQRFHAYGRRIIWLLIFFLCVMITPSCAFVPQNEGLAPFQNPPEGWQRISGSNGRIVYWIPENWTADFPDPAGDVFYPGHFYPTDDTSSAFISVDFIEPVDDYFSNPIHPIKYVSPEILEKGRIGDFPCIKYESGANRIEWLCLIGHIDASKFNEDSVVESFDIALRLFVDTADESQLNSTWETFVELFIQEQESYLMAEIN